MPHIYGNFDANGNSDTFVATGVDIVIGNDSSDFGGGTVKIQVKLNDQADWTTDSEYTAQGVYTTLNQHGLKFRLNLSGATSPDIDYAVQY